MFSAFEDRMCAQLCGCRIELAEAEWRFFLWHHQSTWGSQWLSEFVSYLHLLYELDCGEKGDRGWVGLNAMRLNKNFVITIRYIKFEQVSTISNIWEQFIGYIAYGGAWLDQQSSKWHFLFFLTWGSQRQTLCLDLTKRFEKVDSRDKDWRGDF